MLRVVCILQGGGVCACVRACGRVGLPAVVWTVRVQCAMRCCACPPPSESEQTLTQPRADWILFGYLLVRIKPSSIWLPGKPLVGGLRVDVAVRALAAKVLRRGLVRHLRHFCGWLDRFCLVLHPCCETFGLARFLLQEHCCLLRQEAFVLVVRRLHRNVQRVGLELGHPAVLVDARGRVLRKQSVVDTDVENILRSECVTKKE